MRLLSVKCSTHFLCALMTFLASVWNINPHTFTTFTPKLAGLSAQVCCHHAFRGSGRVCVHAREQLDWPSGLSTCLFGAFEDFKSHFRKDEKGSKGC